MSLKMLCRLQFTGKMLILLLLLLSIVGETKGPREEPLRPGRRKRERQERKKAFLSSLDSGQQRRTALWVVGGFEGAGAVPGTHNSRGPHSHRGPAEQPVGPGCARPRVQFWACPGVALLSRTHVHNGFRCRLPTVFPNELPQFQRHGHRHHANVGQH